MRTAERRGGDDPCRRPTPDARRRDASQCRIWSRLGGPPATTIPAAVEVWRGWAWYLGTDSSTLRGCGGPG